MKWKVLLVGLTVLFLSLFLLAPLAAILVEALRKGAGAYLRALIDPDALAAIRLTLVCALAAVTASVGFGLCAAWAVTRFRFRGKSLLLTFIDLPFAVSPVVAGLLMVLVFGGQGWLGRWHLGVLFATPGIMLATIFVSFPFVARELIPLMQEQGTEEEEAALLLGASGWQTFVRITLPKIKWGLLYGVILCERAGDGRIWGGERGFGPYPGQDEYGSVAR